MPNSASRAKKRKAESGSLPRRRYEVDILTPVYGGAHFVRGLAQSLLEDVDAGLAFHWILIDDATPEQKGHDEVIALLRDLRDRYENVTVVENRVNAGFAKANNLAARKGSAPLILLLNSDTQAKEDGWLARMAENFRQPAMGAVGARLLFFEEAMLPQGTDDKARRDRPYGRVQHAGVAFNLLGQPYHIFMGWSPDHPKIIEKRIMRAVTGACLMTRRQLWGKLGGLAEVYTVGNFEDVEYCVQCTARGNLVVYDPSVCLYHFGSGSENTETSVKNQQIFQLRNRHLITYDAWNFY